MTKEHTAAPIGILEWDSSKFGYNVASIESTTLNARELGIVLKHAAKSNIRLLYWSLDPENQISNSAAITAHGLLTDRKEKYVTNVGVKDLMVDPKIKSILGMRPSLQSLKLAFAAGVYSRFKVDPNFKNREFEILYGEWIRKSLSGEIAQEVLGYLNGENLIGLITLGEHRGRANIGLLAVAEEYRGKGMGKKLIEGGLKWARRKGFKTMDVVTQNANEGACKFYEKCGFKLESSVNIYHFWL